VGQQQREEEGAFQHEKGQSSLVTILNARRAGNLPPQRVDQLIHLVDEVLHLALVVAAIGAEC
jgi:hypothetical protein